MLPGQARRVVALATDESRQTNQAFLVGLERRIKRSWRVQKDESIDLGGVRKTFLAGLE